MGINTTNSLSFTLSSLQRMLCSSQIVFSCTYQSSDRLHICSTCHSLVRTSDDSRRVTEKIYDTERTPYPSVTLSVDQILKNNRNEHNTTMGESTTLFFYTFTFALHLPIFKHVFDSCG